MAERCANCGRPLGPGNPGVCDRCIDWAPTHPMIDPLACIGRPPEHRDHPMGTPGLWPQIDPEARIEAYCTVDSGIKQATAVGRAWLMKSVYVGHDAVVSDGVELAAHTTLGGHVVLERNVRVGLGALFKPFVHVGEGARIGMGAVVIRDVPAGEVWAGNPARQLRGRDR